MVDVPLNEMTTQVTGGLADDLHTDVVPKRYVNINKCFERSSQSYSPWHTRHFGPVKHVLERLVKSVEFHDTLVGHIFSCYTDTRFSMCSTPFVFKQ
jgi:hypothetical protein